MMGLAASKSSLHLNQLGIECFAGEVIMQIWKKRNRHRIPKSIGQLVFPQEVVNGRPERVGTGTEHRYPTFHLPLALRRLKSDDDLPETTRRPLGRRRK
jgi:hypothetical protein